MHMLLLLSFDMPNGGQMTHQSYVFGYILAFFLMLFSKPVDKLDVRIYPFSLVSTLNIAVVMIYIILGFFAQYFVLLILWG